MARQKRERSSVADYNKLAGFKVKTDFMRARLARCLKRVMKHHVSLNKLQP